MERKSGIKPIEQHPYKSVRECPNKEDRLIGGVLCVPPPGPEVLRRTVGFPDGEDFRELKKELKQFAQRTVRQIKG